VVGIRKPTISLRSNWRKANPDAVQQPGDAAADVAVSDRNAVHQLLRKVPPSFGELATYIFRSFLPPVSIVHFVTQMSA